MAESTLTKRCRLVGASPKDSLALGRLTRVVRLGDALSWCPEHFLDVLDPRTVDALLTKGGLSEARRRERPDVSVLFQNHRFRVPHAGVRVLARLVADTRPFPAERQFSPCWPARSRGLGSSA